MEKTKLVFSKLKIYNNGNFFSKNSLPVSLRRPESQMRYMISKKSGLTKQLIDEPRIKEWKHWLLIDNAFPYDTAFKTSHILIPKRVVTKERLDKVELEELNSVMDELSLKYDCYMVNFSRKQSVKAHFHIHFLIYYDNREDCKI